MINFNKSEILETVRMLSSENLDVRTVTMALSLFDCVGSSGKETAELVYNKVVKRAGRLREVCDELSETLGVPIVNKRVSVTPVSLIGARGGGYELIAKALDDAAEEIGIDFIGGYSALLHKGMTNCEREFLDTIPSALSKTRKVCSSVNVGSTRSGINLDAVKLVGEKIKELSLLTAESGGSGCAKFVVFCNAVEDNPFMAGAFTGVGEGDSIINVGVSGPGVVACALRKLGKSADIMAVAEEIKRTAFKITRVG